MSTNPPDFNQIQRAVTTTLQRALGADPDRSIVLLVLGATAIVIPPLATLAVALLIGWLFLISGVVGLIMTFRMRQAPGFGWSLVSAILAIVAGVVLLDAAGGALSLTLVLIVFFIIEGVASIMYALDHSRELSGRWGWMAAAAPSIWFWRR